MDLLRRMLAGSLEGVAPETTLRAASRAAKRLEPQDIHSIVQSAWSDPGMPQEALFGEKYPPMGRTGAERLQEVLDALPEPSENKQPASDFDPRELRNDLTRIADGKPPVLGRTPIPYADSDLDQEALGEPTQSGLMAVRAALTGENADVLVNPSRRDLEALQARLRAQGASPSIKWSAGPDGAAYVWPAKDMGHDHVIEQLKLGPALELPRGTIDYPDDVEAFFDELTGFRKATKKAASDEMQAFKTDANAQIEELTGQMGQIRKAQRAMIEELGEQEARSNPDFAEMEAEHSALHDHVNAIIESFVAKARSGSSGARAIDHRYNHWKSVNVDGVRGVISDRSRRRAKDLILGRLDGDHIDDIADLVGYSTPSPANKLRKNVIEDVRLLREGGVAMDKIADRYGVDPDALEEFLKVAYAGDARRPIAARVDELLAQKMTPEEVAKKISKEMNIQYTASAAAQRRRDLEKKGVSVSASKAMTPFSEADAKRLLDLRKEGKNPRQMAEIISRETGTPRTRNSVMGYMFRNPDKFQMSSAGAFSDPSKSQMAIKTKWRDEVEELASSIEQANKFNLKPANRLSTFVRQFGGIRDDRGDIAALEDAGRGASALINTKGEPLEYVIEEAVARGLFPRDRPPTPREFIDALSEDLRNPGAALSEEARYAREAIDYYDQLGIDTSLRGKNLRMAIDDFLRKQEDGPPVARMFFGPESRKADHAKHAMAERLAKAGVPMDDIRAATGWWRAADGHWRGGEFSDAEMRIIPEGADGQWRRLDQIIDHPEFFEHYPDARKITARTTEPGSGGVYRRDRQGPHIQARNDDTGYWAHEMQHFVQDTEGWSRGGSPSEFHPQGAQFALTAKEALTWRDAVLESPGAGSYETKEAALIDLLKQQGRQEEIADPMARSMAANQERWSDELLDYELNRYGLRDKGVPDSPQEAYYRLHGEWEAWKTQKRQNMTQAERDAFPADYDGLTPADFSYAYFADTPRGPHRRDPRRAAASIESTIARALDKKDPIATRIGRAANEIAIPGALLIGSGMSALSIRQALLDELDRKAA